MSNKKTFGQWMNSVFESHMKDLSDESLRYINTNLKTELGLIGTNFKWARHLQNEFSQISGLLRKKVMECPHNQEEKKVKTEGWEKCEMCECYRYHKYNEDNFRETYYERSFEIMEQYKNELSEDERKVLDDFYQRKIGDMSRAEKWAEYDAKMKAVFSKYPIWEEWQY